VGTVHTLLYAIQSPLYWQISKKTILCSGFKNPYKKTAKQEYSSLFMNSILQNRNRGRKPDKNWSMKKLSKFDRWLSKSEN
jgi:hypothetical protein